MSFSEQALAFDCAGERLLGVLSRPASASPLGVVIVVGGPQTRVGAHRQFVLLARALAAAGHAVLRFDCRGMGDSEGARRDFEGFGADIGSAIDALQAAEPQVRRVALWGLCDGASAALLYLHERSDPRVAALALLNPWVRSAHSLAQTHLKHYYRQRLVQREFWAKLFAGEVAGRALRELASNLRSAFGAGARGGAPALAFQDRMARAWSGFGGAVLLLLSEDDYTAREFVEYTRSNPAWQRALQARPPQRVSVAAADHSCSQPAAARAVEEATARWLAALG